MDSSRSSSALGPSPSPAPSTFRPPTGARSSGGGHAHDLTPFLHDHRYEDAGAAARSRALVLVSLVTLLTMVLELAVGYASGSRALTADGWHMATHVVALGGAALAARLARGVGAEGRFAFGGWKIEVLAAYTSGLFLLAVAGGIAIDAARTLASPQAIEYREAMIVAVLGLLINLACAWILMRSGADHGHGHGHGHGHSHSHSHDHDRSHDGGHSHAHPHAHDAGRAIADAPADLNFNAATMHVVADAFTSVLAIAALAGGWLGGWRWLDPLVAIVGAVVIARWAYGVIRSSAATLVDGGTDPDLLQRIRERIEGDGDARIADLHAWQIASGTYAAVVSIVADSPMPPHRYNERLASLPGLRHVTVEVHRCRGEAAAAADASG